jgi:hypothetical protein
LNSLWVCKFRAADRQAIGVRQQQPHRLDVAGIAQFAELFGKPLAINRLAQDRARFFTGPRAPAWVAAYGLFAMTSS